VAQITRPELRLIQLGGQPAGGDQLLMPAAFHDPTFFDHQYLVGVSDRRQPMRCFSPPESR